MNAILLTLPEGVPEGEELGKVEGERLKDGSVLGKSEGLKDGTVLGRSEGLNDGSELVEGDSEEFMNTFVEQVSSLFTRGS